MAASRATRTRSAVSITRRRENRSAGSASQGASRADRPQRASLMFGLGMTNNGTGPGKLLELNYDTPTSLYAAAAFQWGWLEQCIERGLLPKHADQFNSIDTKLHQAFAQVEQAMGKMARDQHFGKIVLKH